MTALHERRKNMKEICFAEVKTVQDNPRTGKLFFSSAAFYDIIIALDFFPYVSLFRFREAFLQFYI